MRHGQLSICICSGVRIKKIIKMFIERKKTMWERFYVPGEYAKEVKWKLKTGMMDALDVIERYNLWENAENMWDSEDSLSVDANSGYPTEIAFEESTDSWEYKEVWNNKKIIKPIFNRIQIL